MTDRPQTISIAEDKRARIPFAMIGVIILLSSTAVIGVLETRPEAPRDDSNLDVSVAVDRAVSSSQTTLKSAISEATKAAAKEPVTTTAGTPAGNAIEAGVNEPSSNKYAHEYDTFKEYVRLRIYLEAHDRLGSVSQRMRDNTTTRVSLPDVENTQSSIRNAIERVDLTVGNEDASDDVEPGTVKATIENIGISVYRRGKLQTEATKSITVTVPTTAFDLHKKTQLYQKRLNMGFFHPETFTADGLYKGLGRKMAARYYLLAYSKAYLQSFTGGTGGVSFDKILSTKDIEFLTNQAMFGVQKSVFGKNDRYADRYMKGAWLCFMARQSESLMTGLGKGSGSYGSTAKKIRKNVCTATQYLFGDVSGAYPGPADFLNRPPWNAIRSAGSTTDLGMLRNFFGSQGPGSHSAEIQIDKFAQAAVVDTDPTEVFNIDLEAGSIHPDNSKPRGLDDNKFEISSTGPAVMFGGTNHVQQAVQDVFTVNTWSQTSDYTTVTFDTPDNDNKPSSGDESDWSADHSNLIVTSSSVDVVDHETPWESQSGRQRTFHEFRVQVSNELKERTTWVNSSADPDDYATTTSADTGTVTYEATVTVTGKHSTGIDRDNSMYGSGHDLHQDVSSGDEYRGGGGYPSSGPYSGADNFKRGPDQALNALWGVGPNGDLETKFENHVQSAITANDIVYQNDFRNEVRTLETNSDIPVGKLFDGDRGALKSWLINYVLRDARNYVQNNVGSVETDTTAVAQGEHYQELKNNLRRHKEEIIWGSGGKRSYRNAPDKTAVTLRYIYYQNILKWIDNVQDKQEQAKTKINGDIASNIPGISGGDQPLGEAFEFVGGLFSGNLPRDQGTFEESPLLEDVSYEVKGSPTFLPNRSVSRLTVPAVRPRGTPSDMPVDAMHAPLSVKRTNFFGYPGLPLLPWPPFWFVSVDGWNMEAKGEYARFKVTATRGDGPGTPATSYVRQDQKVRLLIDGKERYVGDVDPIDVSSLTTVITAVPGGAVPLPGVPAVGDRQWKSGVSRFSCSKTWPNVGPGIQQQMSSPASCFQGGGTGLDLERFIPSGSSTVSCAAGLADTVTSAGLIRASMVGASGNGLIADDDMDDCGDTLEVDVIDVGQGQSILIQAPKSGSDEVEDILIDAGSTANTEAVTEHLRSERVGEIDKLVLTHVHQDHVTLVDDLADMPVVESDDEDDDDDSYIEEAYYPGVEHPDDPDYVDDLTDALDVSELDDIEQLREGDGDELFSGSNVDFDVLNPPDNGRNPPKDSGDDDCVEPIVDCNSIVLKVEYSSKSFLLSSDIREPTEGELVDEGADLNADVLQLSHHGTKDGNTREYLDAVDPEYAFSSARESDKWPHVNAIQRLIGTGAEKLFTTADHGTIEFSVCTCTGGTIAVETEQDDSADPEDVRDRQQSDPDQEYEDLEDLQSIGTSRAAQLEAAGYEEVEDLRDASVGDLADVDEIGDETAEDIKEQLADPHDEEAGDDESD